MPETNVDRVVPGSREAQRLTFRVRWSANGKSLEAAQFVGLTSPVNPSLLFEKFLPHAADVANRIGASPAARELRLRSGQIEAETSRLALAAWAALANESDQQEGLATVVRAHKAGARAFLTFETAGRMVVGSGAKNAYEIGLTVHPLYGVPTIPGSSLKGLARASVEPFVEKGDSIQTLYRWMRGTAEPCLPPELEPFAIDDAKTFLVEVFGSRFDSDPAGDRQQGAVVVHDALATEGPPWYELDVLTPHYGAYYRCPTTAPSDRASSGNTPNPVVFPVVRAGVRLGVGLRLTKAARSRPIARRSAWIAVARDVLIHALETFGAGSKTGAGYGRLILRGIAE